MARILDGFGFSGYRSFGSFQKISPLDHLSVIIGENNSGKSNVLSFLADFLPGALEVGAKSRQINPNTDLHKPVRDESVRVGYAIRPDARRVQALREQVKKHGSLASQGLDELFKIMMTGDDGLLWINKTANPFPGKYALDMPVLGPKRAHEAQFNKLWTVLTSTTGGNYNLWVHESYQRVVDAITPKIDVEFIPAFRRIVASEISHATGGEMLATENNSGRGMVQRLLEIQVPKFDQLNREEEFKRLVAFVRGVLENESATIKIPYGHSPTLGILVEVSGKTLPLESYGTGLHQLLVMATYCTVFTDTIVCLEEPEVFLHPRLQKKLFQYLKENTQNQYLISSHSPQAVNTEGSVISIRLEAGESKVKAASSDLARAELCADLGLRPSDLLQSNCVIWVEGPSDRILLVAWLKKLAPELKEGIHFSVMFYGGTGNLEHLSGDGEGVIEDFINLTRLNRRVVFVVDSDRADAAGSISETKERIASEVSGANGFVWITEGKELENYLQPDQLLAAARALRKNFVRLNDDGQYSANHKVWVNREGAEQLIDLSKVSLAHAVVNLGIEPGRFDCQERIAQLVEYIRQSNV